MQGRREELLGKKFGKWTVIAVVPNFRQQCLGWKCRCECGNEAIILTNHLIHSKSTRCKICYHKDKVINPFGGLWWNMIANAKKRKISFNITREYAWDLLNKQDFKCALTGLPITVKSGKWDKTIKTASLDRIDSSMGYEIGNVQWVHKDINWMKQDYSQEEFIHYCVLIANHYSSLNANPT